MIFGRTEKTENFTLFWSQRQKSEPTIEGGGFGDGYKNRWRFTNGSSHLRF